MYDHTPLAFGELIADAPDRPIFIRVAVGLFHARVIILCQIDHVPLV